MTRALSLKIALLAGMWFGTLTPAVALAEPSASGAAAVRTHESDPSEMWTPAIGFAFGLDIQEVSARSRTTRVQQPFTRRSGGRFIRPGSTGESITTQPTIGLDLELMSPQIGSDWVGDQFAPRFFVSGGVEANLASLYLPSTEGARGPLSQPLDAQGDPVSPFKESSILGQGTASKVQFDRLQFRAGGGVAFEFDIEGRTLRWRTLAEYIRKEVEFSGGLSRGAQQCDPCPGPNTAPMNDFDAHVRQIIIDVSENEVIHALGIGTELEFDAYETGPFFVTFMTGFRVYNILSDTDFSYTGVGPNPSTPAETATFSYVLDEWITRFTVGMRFRLAP